MTPRTFQQVIKKHNAAFEKKTDALFQRYYKEVKTSKLETISETNLLWNSKYKKALEKMEAANDKKYKTIWEKFHKK